MDYKHIQSAYRNIINFTAKKSEIKQFKRNEVNKKEG